MNKPLLRVDEAAEVLAVSRWTIYRWVEQGRLEGTKIGRGTLRVLTRSIDRLVAQNRVDESPSVVLTPHKTSAPLSASIR